MDLFRIKCFLKAAEYKSMTKAAELMNITQPAMSFQVRQLERELDMKLLARDNRGIALTEEGAFLYQGFSQMLANYDQLIEGARRISEKKRRLVIGYHGPVTWAGVTDFIADFSARHPELEVAIVKQQWKELMEYLRMGVIDAAFLETGELGDGADLECVHLFSERTCFAVNKNHRLAGRSSVTVDDIKDEKICMNNHASASMNSIIDRLYRTGLKKTNLMFFDSMEDTFAMAACNQGMASLPVSFKTDNPALKFIDYDAESTIMDYTLVRSAGNGSPTAKLFLEEAAAAAWPYVREGQ